jgi:hypothetical protein
VRAGREDRRARYGLVRVTRFRRGRFVNFHLYACSVARISPEPSRVLALPEYPIGTGAEIEEVLCLVTRVALSRSLTLKNGSLAR